MIARMWHGIVKKEHFDEYAEYVNRTGVPGSRSTPGNCGMYLLRRIKGDHAHFLTISLWDSLDSIRKFAGEDIEKARYYPEDKNYLLEMEPTVQHYEIFAESFPE